MQRTIIIDDEPEYRAWFRSQLEGSEEFHVVGEAGTGEEAHRLAARHRPDLVIVDLYLGDTDGLEICRVIKQCYPDTNVILTSAQSGRAYDRLAKEEGALAFIPKKYLSLNSLLRFFRNRLIPISAPPP